MYALKYDQLGRPFDVTSGTRTCEDCRWRCFPDRWPGYQVGEPSPHCERYITTVNGTPTLCITARASEMLCGLEGRGFEPADEAATVIELRKPIFEYR